MGRLQEWLQGLHDLPAQPSHWGGAQGEAGRSDVSARRNRQSPADLLVRSEKLTGATYKLLWPSCAPGSWSMINAPLLSSCSLLAKVSAAIP